MSAQNILLIDSYCGMGMFRVLQYGAPSGTSKRLISTCFQSEPESQYVQSEVKSCSPFIKVNKSSS